MRKGTFFCIDGHTCGNPVRLVTSGHPNLKGRDMSEKRQDFIRNHDWIRQSLMFEPRGHDMMSGAFIYPPERTDSDASLLFIETSGCLPMCGHGTIGAVTFALEQGLLTASTPGQLLLDVPAGQIKLEYSMSAHKVEWVKIYNVPAYLAHQNVELDVPGLGKIDVDISYGGNFYIIVEPQENYPGLQQWSAANILHFSPIIRNLVNQKVDCIHPQDPTVTGASHLLWTGQPKTPNSHAANAVFYGEKAIDRSPCGTGTSARMAQLFAKGRLNVGDEFIHESYIGSQFIGHIEKETKVGSFTGIRPSIKGWARCTGNNCIHVDDDDPYAFGFQVI
jgi:proline racemase